MPQSDPIVEETITYPAPHGAIEAFLAKPAGEGPWPAILIGQEAFGVAPHILEVTRRFAREGYLALMPDLYSNDATRKTLTVEEIDAALPLSRLDDPSAELAKLAPERRAAIERALAWRKTTMPKLPAYADDLGAALPYLRARADVRADAIGLIGYCMGGALVGELLARGAAVAGASIYYGRLPDPARAEAIVSPLEGHFGGADAPLTSLIPAFEAAMRAAGKPFEAFVYDGAPHAFFNDTRSSYTASAARDAWARTLRFFADRFAGAPT